MLYKVFFLKNLVKLTGKPQSATQKFWKDEVLKEFGNLRNLSALAVRQRVSCLYNTA